MQHVVILRVSSFILYLGLLFSYSIDPFYWTWGICILQLYITIVKLPIYTLLMSTKVVS